MLLFGITGTVGLMESLEIQSKLMINASAHRVGVALDTYARAIASTTIEGLEGIQIASLNFLMARSLLLNEYRMNLTIRLADLAESASQTAVIDLLDHYSTHEMGGNQPLPCEVKGRLIEGLRAHPMSRVFLAYDIDRSVGIAVCFIGFSTFKAKPLINIHDLAVHESYRGRGVGSQLIDAVVEFANSLECCAITLEVRADNPARRLYSRKGFRTLGEPLAPDTNLFGKLMLNARELSAKD